MYSITTGGYYGGQTLGDVQMARSQIKRLKAIEQKEARARELLAQIEKEREKVVAPTRAKIEALFGRVLSETIRERLESVVGVRLNQAVLEKDFREVLNKHFAGKKNPLEKEIPREMLIAEEEDDMSLKIANELENFGEIDSVSGSQE